MHSQGPDFDTLSPNFLRQYGHLSLSDLTSDWKQVEVTADDEAWAKLPPRDFIEFVKGYPRVDFDTVPQLPNHLKAPTFLMCQAHRIWLTASVVHEQLVRRNAKRFLDLGGFPFFNSLVLRDYFGFDGAITVTTNVDVTESSKHFLASRDIDVAMLDLDPFVSDPANGGKRLPASLAKGHGTFDVILSSHVIEHLYHPATMLGECQRLLSTDGCMVTTTDNAMMVDVLANFIGGYGYIFEPVENTAAMIFNFWRGHVRFFTSRDLRVLLESAGCTVQQVHYFHCFYEVMLDDYFRDSKPVCSGWKKKLISEVPWLRNELCVVAGKSGANS